MTKKSSLVLATFLMLCFIYFNVLAAQEAQETKIDETIQKPFDCVSELMSRPSCINRLNATRACKMFGGSPEAVVMIRECVLKQGFNGQVEVLAPANIMAICLAGISSSTKVSDNETFCKVGDVNPSIGVSESTMPKNIDSKSSLEKASSSINVSK
ncbi:MAG: hypothetical protein K2Q18_13620 [Bdellovibrionales bacterium]|nr:hypothetical protein [Bdellovibrionales bacterium]